MVNRSAVLWCGRDLWVETGHSHLPRFALCRKTTLNKQRAAKPYKMAMIIEPKLHRKGNLQQAQVYIISIFVPVFLHFNNYIEFFVQSLQIVHNMQNSIETRSNLCTKLGLPVFWAKCILLVCYTYQKWHRAILTYWAILMLTSNVSS